MLKLQVLTFFRVNDPASLLHRQVMEAVHGVTIEEAHGALRRNEWNPMVNGIHVPDHQYVLSNHDCITTRVCSHNWLHKAAGNQV